MFIGIKSDAFFPSTTLFRFSDIGEQINPFTDKKKKVKRLNFIMTDCVRKRHLVVFSTPEYIRVDAAPPSDKHLLVDPHERARVVGFALVLDAVEAVPPLAVVPLVVVVVLHLPHRLKQPHLCELKEKHVHKQFSSGISERPYLTMRR